MQSQEAWAPDSSRCSWFSILPSKSVLFSKAHLLGCFLFIWYCHLEQNGKSTGDITPQSVRKPGGIMSPPPELWGQSEAAAGVNPGNWIATNPTNTPAVLLGFSLLTPASTVDCIWESWPAYSGREHLCQSMIHEKSPLLDFAKWRDAAAPLLTSFSS